MIILQDDVILVAVQGRGNDPTYKALIASLAEAHCLGMVERGAEESPLGLRKIKGGTVPRGEVTEDWDGCLGTYKWKR